MSKYRELIEIYAAARHNWSRLDGERQRALVLGRANEAREAGEAWHWLMHGTHDDRFTRLAATFDMAIYRQDRAAVLSFFSGMADAYRWHFEELVKSDLDAACKRVERERMLPDPDDQPVDPWGEMAHG